MTRDSQYVDSYLNGPAYTVGTFLKYTLAGKAARYMGRYAAALTRSLERRVQTGEVIVATSIRGGRAYRRAE